MKVYKLRDVKTRTFINKKNSKADRIYQDKRTAASAASHLSIDKWNWSTDRSWYHVSKEERRAFRESIIQIVEFDCVEVEP